MVPSVAPEVALKHTAGVNPDLDVAYPPHSTSPLVQEYAPRIICLGAHLVLTAPAPDLVLPSPVEERCRGHQHQQDEARATRHVIEQAQGQVEQQAAESQENEHLEHEGEVGASGALS